MDIERKNVGKFNEELLKFVDEKYPELLKQIAEKKALDDSIKETLDKAIKEHKELFNI